MKYQKSAILGYSTSSPQDKSCTQRPNNWPAEHRNAESIYYKIFQSMFLNVSKLVSGKMHQALTIYNSMFITSQGLILVKFMKVMLDRV